jgi:hypothetical protein
MTVVLDAASKLEVTRRCLVEAFEKMEPIRKALQVSANRDQGDLEEARQALDHLDKILSEMKQTIEATGT